MDRGRVPRSQLDTRFWKPRCVKCSAQITPDSWASGGWNGGSVTTFDFGMTMECQDTHTYYIGVCTKCIPSLTADKTIFVCLEREAKPTSPVTRLWYQLTGTHELACECGRFCTHSQLMRNDGYHSE